MKSKRLSKFFEKSIVYKFRSSSLILKHEVGVQNLVCGYILRLRSVAYCFWVTSTLASGLCFRKIKERIYPELSNNFPQMYCIRHVTVKYPVYHRLCLVRQKKVNEYDPEIPQSQTADQPTAS